jgi:hypothetical protein
MNSYGMSDEIDKAYTLMVESVDWSESEDNTDQILTMTNDRDRTDPGEQKVVIRVKEDSIQRDANGNVDPEVLEYAFDDILQKTDEGDFVSIIDGIPNSELGMLKNEWHQTVLDVLNK